MGTGCWQLPFAPIEALFQLNGPRLRRFISRTVILAEQTCPNRAGSRPAPPEMGEEAS